MENQFTVKPMIEYATLLQRFGAFLIDACIWAPLSLVAIGSLAFGPASYTVQVIAMAGLIYWYNVHLVAKYGGTPGKLLMGIRLRKLFDDKMDQRAALIRYIPTLGMLAVSWGMSLNSAWSMGEFDPNSSLVEIYLQLGEGLQTSGLSMLMGVWVWSEFIVMLFNKERRAIHDYIAGTIVVRDRSVLKKFILTPNAWIALVVLVGAAAQAVTFKMVWPVLESSRDRQKQIFESGFPPELLNLPQSEDAPAEATEETPAAEPESK